MNAGELKRALEGVPDGAEVRIEGEAWISETSSGWLNVKASPMSLRLKGDTFVLFRGEFGFRWNRTQW